MINAQFRLNYHTVEIKQFEKFGQPFQRLWVWAKPTNTFRLCNLMIAKQFAVLRLERNAVSLEKRKQQETEIVISLIKYRFF